MKLVVVPGHPLQGQATLPGDKSLSHRAALLGALADGESRIENFLVAGVTRPLLDALASLGVPWALTQDTLTIAGQGLFGFHPSDVPLDCGNSATTMRLLAGALAAAGITATLDGSPGLRHRPMGRIVTPLHAMGVHIEASPQGTAPLRLRSRSPNRWLQAIEYTLPVASAQVKSCLLLAALAADGPCILSEPARSRDHTERMLRSIGVSVESLGHFSPDLPSTSSQPNRQVTPSQLRSQSIRITPPPSRSLQPLHLKLPGDISSAAFLIVAALITPGSEISLRDVLLNPTRTGLLDVLGEMGADLTVTISEQRNGEPVGDILVRHSHLQGIAVDGSLVARMIDEFPILAVAAAFARGKTLVRGAEELRYKESDRIATLCQELRALGVEALETPDGFIVQGKGFLRGGVVQSHSDHRLAMALAIAGLASREPVVIHQAHWISESFPAFVPTLQSLGASLWQEE